MSAQGTKGARPSRGFLSEVALLLAVSAAGIYGLGRGLARYFHRGTDPGQVAWLAVTAVAFMILSRQMARVHERWPRRRPTRTVGPERDGQPASVRSWWWPTRVVTRGPQPGPFGEGGPSDGAP